MDKLNKYMDENHTLDIKIMNFNAAFAKKSTHKAKTYRFPMFSFQ